MLTDRKLASQEYCHTRRISTEESKKANSDVQRTPKIWHRNDKNHKKARVTIFISDKTDFKTKGIEKGKEDII